MAKMMARPETRYRAYLNEVAKSFTPVRDGGKATAKYLQEEQRKCLAKLRRLS